MPAASSDEWEQAVPHDDRHPGLDQRTRHVHRSLQAAGVVRGDHSDLLAEHAAPRVQILDRQLHGDPVAFAGFGEGSGQRMGKPNLDLGYCGRPGCDCGQGQAENQG